MRELLTDVREWINDATVNHKGMMIQREILLRKIDAALAAPEPNAMELAHLISGIFATAEDNAEMCGHGVGVKRMIYEKAYSEAAALIETCGKRVPSKVLSEYADLYFLDYALRIDKDGLQKRTMEAVAAKYGVKLEG